MPLMGCYVERRPAIHCLKIDLTESCNQLFCNCLIPETGRVVQWRVPKRALVVDESLWAWHRQQRSNRRCIALTHSMAKLRARHGKAFPDSSRLAAFSLLWFLWSFAILLVTLLHRLISIFLLHFGVLGASLQ